VKCGTQWCMVPFKWCLIHQSTPHPHLNPFSIPPHRRPDLCLLVSLSIASPNFSCLRVFKFTKLQFPSAICPWRFCAFSTAPQSCVLQVVNASHVNKDTLSSIVWSHAVPLLLYVSLLVIRTAPSLCSLACRTHRAYYLYCTLS
jgi:hypothetical protein